MDEEDKKMKRIEDIYSSSPQIQKKKQKVEDSHDEGADKQLLIGNVGKEIKKKAIKKREKKVSGERKPTFGVVPPVFEQDIISYIQLHDEAEKRPSLLLKKKLDLDDVDRSLNRLVIGRCTPLLTELLAEMNKEKSSDHDFVRFITRDVRGIDNELRLKKKINSTDDTDADADDDEYVLGHKWNDVVHILGLQEGDTIEGWGFSLQDEFRMTIVVFKKP